LKLSEVASLTMGSSPPGSSYNEEGEGMPFYQGVRDFKRRYPGLRVWTNAPVRVAKSDDTLISVRAPVGDLNRAFEGCCIGRGVAAVHSDWPSTIYYSLRAASDLWEPFQQEGTVFGAINRADLAAANVPWPATSQLVNLEVGLVALDNQIRLLTSEKDRLVQLRDTLLPELLSGRIRVTEAHEAVT
jgi:type I restriction enzyme S subunit